MPTGCWHWPSAAAAGKRPAGGILRRWPAYSAAFAPGSNAWTRNSPWISDTGFVLGFGKFDRFALSLWREDRKRLTKMRRGGILWPQALCDGSNRVGSPWAWRNWLSVGSTSSRFAAPPFLPSHLWYNVPRAFIFEDKPCDVSLGLEKLAVGRSGLLPLRGTPNSPSTLMV